MKNLRLNIGKSIGISIGFHLTVAGVLFFIAFPASRRTMLVESVIQVNLVGLSDADPIPSNRARSMKSVPVLPSAPKLSGTAKEEISKAAEPVVTIEADKGPTDSETVLITNPHASPSGKVAESSVGVPIQSEERSGEIESRRNEMALFLENVRRRLEEAKRYPWPARIQGLEGTVRLQFKIDSMGEPKEIRLVESSRWPVLDEEAVATVKRIGKFPGAPVSWNRDANIQVPLVFQLE